MVFNLKEGECPVCGINGRITRKWVINNYGKRYDYFIYHHDGYIHYSNQNSHIAKRFKKGDLEKLLIETINSQEFKLGSFRIKDMKKLLVKEFPDIGFGSIKVSLNRLDKLGIIEKMKKGRNLHYVNTVSKDRLSFVIVSLSISLEDENNDSMYTKHTFVYEIKNDHSWPLYYIPFRYVGDVGTTFENLELVAIDPATSKGLKVILMEDGPTDKRVLLKLSTPLLPEESRRIQIVYRWPEPKQLFVFSAATMMDSFEFITSANRLTRLNVSMTSASRNETKDLSNIVREISSGRWKSVNSIKFVNVEPFSVLQFKWRL